MKTILRPGGDKKSNTRGERNQRPLIFIHPCAFHVERYIVKRPDTRQSSHGRLGRSSNAKISLNSKMLWTDRWTYIPTEGPTDGLTNTAKCRVACPRVKRVEVSKRLSTKACFLDKKKHDIDRSIGTMKFQMTRNWIWASKLGFGPRG